MKKKVIGGMILLVLVVGGGVAFYILSQPPKETLSDEFKQEAVTKLLGRKAQLDDKNIPAGDTEYKGKYITFKYPAKATIYTFRNDPTSTPSKKLEDFSFDIKNPKLVFSMSVTESTGMSSLDDVPSARLREQRSYEYTKTTPTIGTTIGQVYYKGGQDPEKTGFFMTGNKLYTISTTGVVDVEVEKLFDDIISTVSFLP